MDKDKAIPLSEEMHISAAVFSATGKGTVNEWADKVEVLEEDLAHALKQYEHWETEIEKSDAVINAHEEAIFALGNQLDVDDRLHGFSDETKTLVKQIIERMHRDYVMNKGKAIPLTDAWEITTPVSERMGHYSDGKPGSEWVNDVKKYEQALRELGKVWKSSKNAWAALDISDPNLVATDELFVDLRDVSEETKQILEVLNAKTD